MINYEYVNTKNIPEEMAAALTYRERRSYVKDAFASASQLCAPSYSWAIFNRLKSNGATLERDLYRSWASAQGTAIHSLLEEANKDREDVIQKTTFVGEFGEFKISGEPDIYYKETGKLIDLKTTSVSNPLNDETINHWALQTNIYAALLRIAGHEVNKISIIVAFKDWREVEVSRSTKYPESPIMEIELPVWGQEEVEKTIIEKCENMKKVWNEIGYESAAPCTPAERWETPTTYAIQKEDAKRASKVAESREEADAWLATKRDKYAYQVVVREGERKRCANWCDVSAHCPDWKKHLEEKADQ